MSEIDILTKPHGVLGQTWKNENQGKGDQGEGVIEGMFTDYEVNSLWADDFKFNHYKILI
jgi:hypothetical protein